MIVHSAVLYSAVLEDFLAPTRLKSFALSIDLLGHEAPEKSSERPASPQKPPQVHAVLLRRNEELQAKTRHDAPSRCLAHNFGPECSLALTFCCQNTSRCCVLSYVLPPDAIRGLRKFFADTLTVTLDGWQLGAERQAGDER